MSFDRESLLWALRELAQLAGRPDRLVIAYSGGLDSEVLLHALTDVRDRFGVELLALHGETLPGDDPTSWIAAGAAEAVDNHAWHDSLDRFISVMNHARDAGVMYVNGDFRPSDDPGSDTTDDWPVPDFASLGLPNANQSRAEE